MNEFTIKGYLGEDTPAVVDVTIILQSDYDQAILNPNNSLPEDYEYKGIIDTGSRQCFITSGFFKPRHFGEQPLFCEIDSMAQQDTCRGQWMTLSFSSGETTKTVKVPIYESSKLPIQDGCILIGRSVLNHAVFTYDGPMREVALTFSNADSLICDELA